jgi:hypothetical protein
VTPVGKLGRFDYPDRTLSEVVGIAEKIAKDYGGRINASNLASIFGIEPRGAGFQNRIDDIRSYGLMESEGRGYYRLTPLGERVVNGPDSLEAIKEAFLKVPLFKAMHEEFKGNLPEDKSAFTRRLQGITREQEEAVSIRAARLRNHYNDGLRYLTGEVIPSGGEEMEKGGRLPLAGQQLVQIPASLEKIQFGNDLFIFLPKENKETLKTVRKLLDVYIGEEEKPQRSDERKSTEKKAAVTELSG